MITNNVYRIMADRGIMKQARLVELTGLSSNQVSKLVRGETTRIDLGTLNALCEALDCTPGDLLTYTPNGKTKI